MLSLATAVMTGQRRKARQVALQALFACEASKQRLDEAVMWRAEEEGLHDEARAFAQRLAHTAWTHRRELDRLIAQAAPNWPIEQIPPVNRNVLRLALAELFFDRETPPKAVINEAVELAKTFGSETAPRFVNGVLGTIWGWAQEHGEAEVLRSLTGER